MNSVAALAAINANEADRILESLLDENLLIQKTLGRFELHGLLRQYARERAIEEDDQAHHRAAWSRLLDRYAATAALAMDAISPTEHHRPPRLAVPLNPPVGVGDPEAMRSWLEAESSNLLACGHHARHAGFPTYVRDVAATLFRWLSERHQHSDAIALHTATIDAAGTLSDPRGQGTAADDLGVAYWQKGDFTAAVEQLETALQLFLTTADLDGQGRALGNLGNCWASSWRRSGPSRRRSLRPNGS